MNTPKISVIVPVYNVEKYLSRCIESILSQTFTDFELLLIDDGSKDRSGEICDRYAERDSRVKVFHTGNKGVSAARQLGVDNAMGVYSIHIDSDDWVETNMLERMYGRITEMHADMVIADWFLDEDGHARYVRQSTNKALPTEILNEILIGNLSGSLCNKLLRHSLYKDYNLRFIPRLDCCEDVLIILRLLLLDIKVTFLHGAFYHYCSQNTHSITRYYTQETFHSQQLYVEELEKLLPDRYDRTIEFVAYRIKTGAFHHGILTAKEFYHYMPTSLKTILFCKCSIKWRLSMLLSYMKLYCWAKRIWVNYNKS